MFPDAHEQWLTEQAALTYRRLLPRIKSLPFQESLIQNANLSIFISRLESRFERIFHTLYALYGSRYDFFYHLEQIVVTAAHAYLERPTALHALDGIRETNPDWFGSERMIGAVCYVDRFAGSLAKLRDHLPYFESLGLTYLHLMPLFKSPEKNNDGGYAVSSFREVNPALGTMEELAALAEDLRERGISLVLDFVFNHTSDEHDWAQQALKGDPRYQAYYWLFEDRTLPDQYEVDLREIFPEQAPGSFTYRPEIDRWVWTTFFPFQWDLNYANPDVFRAMLDEILFLANQGVEVLRLDAVPFVWKALGTSCENLPQVHAIIQALNGLVSAAAPALLFKSEAIVHPRDVRSYIGSHESQLSYNPILMVSLWEALATRSIDFLRHTMTAQLPLPEHTAWINYIRSHDDIGWGFADEDASAVGINPVDHRYFLSLFYLGRYPGSFAAGLPFNFNPRTIDVRISGTMASLIGLEKALDANDSAQIDNAIGRILLVYAILFSMGGIPLIYLGDELGTLNDYTYQRVPTKAQDNRWVHRPLADPDKMARRTDAATIEGHIFGGIQALVRLRQSTPSLAGNQTQFVDTGNAHVLGYVRNHQLMVLANFTEQPQSIYAGTLAQSGFETRGTHDLITDTPLVEGDRIELAPYQVMWLFGR